jgi:hypothetical protein
MTRATQIDRHFAKQNFIEQDREEAKADLED